MTLQAEDRIEIIELYGRYSWRFDAGEAEGWAALFTPDGTFEIVGSGHVHQGREMLEGFVRRRHAQSPGLRHFVTNIVLDATPNGARGEASVVVLRMEAASLRVLNVGGYRDELVRVGGTWRFQRRRFTSWLDPRLIDASLAHA